jgi:GGDEF domain-containing protein
MRWRRWRMFFWLSAALVLGTAAAHADAQGGIVTLPEDPASEIRLDEFPQALVRRESIDVRRFAASPPRLQPGPPAGGSVQFSTDNELWLPFTLRNPSRAERVWQLQVPLASLDEAVLFDSRGARAQAGDRVAQSQWTRPGRYPRFDLRLEPGETRQFYLRAQNRVAAPLPVRLLDRDTAMAGAGVANLGLGFVLGALALLIASCLVQAAWQRDSAFALYGTYALVLGLSLAASSGLAGQYLWGDAGRWPDVAKATFPPAGAGLSVLLVRALCRLPTRARWLSLWSVAVGIGTIAVALGFALTLEVSAPVLAAAMLLAAVTVFVNGLWTWMRGDAVGGWVLAAHVPLIVITAMVMVRMFGIAVPEFDISLVLSVAIGFILVLLLVALHGRSREDRSVQERSRELASIDPLTGLLSAALFRDRVRAAVARYRKSRHNAVVVYVRLASYARIREVHGSDAAEQSMILAVMKLRRLMPEADCAGRVSEGTLGLIFETVTHRQSIMERAARLVAHGLMPIAELKPEMTLNLQVAAAILSEHPVDAEELLTQLDELLATMSPRTRRPIRFLEPGELPATTAGLDADEPFAPAQG